MFKLISINNGQRCETAIKFKVLYIMLLAQYFSVISQNKLSFKIRIGGFTGWGNNKLNTCTPISH